MWNNFLEDVTTVIFGQRMIDEGTFSQIDNSDLRLAKEMSPPKQKFKISIKISRESKNMKFKLFQKAKNLMPFETLKGVL